MAGLRPCRRCGAAQGQKNHTHSWYCQPCADAVRLEYAKARSLCKKCLGHWNCEACSRIRKERQSAAALRGAAKRALNYPNWRRPAETDSRYWSTKAHAMVKAAIKHGLLPKLDGTIACSDCDQPAVEYDHRDYSRPLSVEPVCRSCNKRRGTAIWPSAEQFAFARPPQPRKTQRKVTNIRRDIVAAIMNLFEYRKKRELTQAELAKMLDCTQGRVAQIESGEKPSFALAQKIAAVTDGQIGLSDMRPDIWPPEPRTRKKAA